MPVSSAHEILDPLKSWLMAHSKGVYVSLELLHYITTKQRQKRHSREKNSNFHYQKEQETGLYTVSISLSFCPISSLPFISQCPYPWSTLMLMSTSTPMLMSLS